MTKEKHDRNLSLADIEKLWAENRQLLLGRVQMLTAIEAGVLIAAYTVCKDHHTAVAAVVLWVGVFLLGVMFLIMHRDMQVRDYFREKMEDAGKMGEFKKHLCGETAYWMLAVPVVLGLVNGGLACVADLICVACRVGSPGCLG